MADLRLGSASALTLERMAASVKRWQLWTLGPWLRAYIIAVVVIAVVVIATVVTAAAAAGAHWTALDLGTYLGLLGCGIVAIESTRSIRLAIGGVGRDLQTVWYLTIALTLPPVCAFLAPLALTAYRLWRVRRAFAYRRVFSNATISLAYGAASIVFHRLPARLALPAPGAGSHAIVWALMAAACGALAWAINNGLLLAAIRLADPEARLRDAFGNREGVVTDIIELSVAVPLALVVAISPLLMVFALPSVVLYRRYLMNAQLRTHVRIDPKTGLLNARTWRHEAEVEIFRALRTGTPLALVVFDIDHFSSLNDTAGHAAGDQVLQEIANVLTEHLHGSGLPGRVGRDEFAGVLPRTGAAEARRIGERIRDHISGQPIAIDNGSHAGFVFRLTVSIGIAVLDHSQRALPELLRAADAALTQAKNSGRNRVCMMPRPGAEDRPTRQARPA
jgi:diguanylate cyclase (GGDEF)-like protein